MVSFAVPADFIIPNVYHTAGSYETSSLVSGSSPVSNGVKLIGLTAMNAGADGYVQIFDGYAAPSGGAVPIQIVKALSNTQVSLDLSFGCLPLTTGCVVVLSSTGPTYTAISNSLWTTAFWI